MVHGELFAKCPCKFSVQLCYTMALAKLPIQGATIENDIRQSAGKEFFDYWAALLPQKEVDHKVKLLWDGQIMDIPPSPSMVLYEQRQWSYETKNPVDLSEFGPTIRYVMYERVVLMSMN